jgi:hypothetical protein
MAKQLDEPNPEISAPVQLPVYEAVANRRTAYDNMMWQAPVLSLTAQAFLFTIALSPGSSRLGRILSSLLALVSAIGSMHLMAKQRFNEHLDNCFLEREERRLGITTLLGTTLHGDTKPIAQQLGVRRPWYVRQSSYRLWMLILAAFATAAILVLFVTWLQPELLG